MLFPEWLIDQFKNEHLQIANKMIEMVELIRENITKDEILPAVSLVVTVGFIMIGGYVMSYLVKMEEESVQRQLGAKGLKVRFTYLNSICHSRLH